MKRFGLGCALATMVLISLSAFSQESSTPGTGPAANPLTVRGCLQRDRGNYLLVEDKTSNVYVLKGVGSKLDKDIHHEVEAKGQTLPGSIKTGIRSEKAGSNPSDTVHGIDGVPLQINDIDADIHVIAKHCKAADAQ